MSKDFVTLYQEGDDDKSLDPLKVRLSSIVAMYPNYDDMMQVQGYTIVLVSSDEFEVVNDEASEKLWEEL